MMGKTRSHWRAASGFSLVELAIAMAVVGLLGILAWRWVESSRAPMQRDAIVSQLAQAQAAVEGFVLAKHRLPCPATSMAGGEDCTASAPAALLLPWRTLGLSSRFGQLHYGVNRSGGFDLASVSPAQVSPDLNIDFSPGIPVLARTNVAQVNTARDAVQAAIDSATVRRTESNGLDWCHTLRRFAAEPDAAGVLRVGGPSLSVPAAFVVAHPGSNAVFEGSNVIGGVAGFHFDLPGRAQTHDFDDLALAVGPGDLSARLGCVTRLGAMQAAAQGAFSSYDAARVVQEYWSLRLFDIKQATSALEGAKTGVTLASMDLAFATAGAALAIASASNTEGMTVFGIALSIASAGLAADELVSAIADRQEAEKALEASEAKELAVRSYVVHAYEMFSDALNAALRLDQKGLNP